MRLSRPTLSAFLSPGQKYTIMPSMSATQYSITYPLRMLVLSAVRGGGRLLPSLAFRIRVNGRQHFPRGGPLIVGGNHVAVMESTLVTVLTAWQIEFLGAADIPHERLSHFMINLYAYDH